MLRRLVFAGFARGVNSVRAWPFNAERNLILERKHVSDGKLRRKNDAHLEGYLTKIGRHSLFGYLVTCANLGIQIGDFVPNVFVVCTHVPHFVS